MPLADPHLSLPYLRGLAAQPMAARHAAAGRLVDAVAADTALHGSMRRALAEVLVTAVMQTDPALYDAMLHAVIILLEARAAYIVAQRFGSPAGNVAAERMRANRHLGQIGRAHV